MSVIAGRPPAVGIATATAFGIAVGIADVASPVSLWFAIGCVALCWWAVQALGVRERRYVFAMLGAAIAIRVLMIAVLFATSDHAHTVSFFWDGDGVYVKRRALAISRMWAGLPVGPLEMWHALHRPYGWSSYIYVLAFVQYLLGAAPYGVHLVAVVLFVSAVALLYRVVRPVYGSAAALLGLAVTLFMPTLISWSVSALKESLYLFLAAVAVAGVVAATRARRTAWRVAAAVASLAAIGALGTVRVNADLLMAGALAVSVLALWPLRARQRRLAVVVAAMLTLVLVSAYSPRVRALALTSAQRAAATHLDYVRSGGHSYHLLDERFYAEPLPAPLTAAEAWRFAGRALVSVAIVPLPWQVASRTELVFLPQQVIWDVLAVFAVIGTIAGMRRDPLVTCVFATVAVVNGAAIAVTNGNIGTMVRLRDMIVPFTTWLSALGAVSAMSWCAAIVTTRSPQPKASGIVDERGRLFGRVNVIDAAIAFVVVALIPLAYGAFLLFREPTPAIVSIAPGQIAAGRAATVTLTGDHLRAYLEPKIGETAAIAFHPQTLTEAEVQLPPLPPGTYDLTLWERGVELVRKRVAVNVVAPTLVTASVRARLIAFPRLLPLLRAGDLDVERPAEPDTNRASLLDVGSDRQTTRAVMSGAASSDGSVAKNDFAAADTVPQVEQEVVAFTATLRVPVVSTPRGWTYHDRLVKIGEPIRFETPRGVVHGWILDVQEPGQ